jgi:hydrogenase maturation protease
MVAVIGIGNPLAGDDGVGIEAVRLLQKVLTDTRVHCMTCERGGLDLLDMLAGYNNVIIVDAAKTRLHPPGTVKTVSFQKPFPTTGSLSLHTIDLQALLGFGTMIGMSMPGKVTVYAVETADPATFREGFSLDVRRAVTDVIKSVTGQLQCTLDGLQLAASCLSEFEEPRGIEHTQL